MTLPSCLVLMGLLYREKHLVLYGIGLRSSAPIEHQEGGQTLSPTIIKIKFQIILQLSVYIPISSFILSTRLRSNQET